MPRAKVNGIELNYEVHGEGYPLVLAHGFTASLEMWADQVPELGKRYRVVVYDSRGHGASEVPRDMEEYRLEHYVEDQRALMDHLEIEEAYVGGLSMGGMIAMRFALEYRERVRALLLCDTAAETGPERQTFETLYNGAGEQAVREQGVGAVMRRGFEALVRALPVPDELPPGVQRHLESLDRMSPDGFLGGAKALRGQESVLERLREIGVPTLIVAAEWDPLLAAGREMQERIEGNQFVLIKGSTHGTCVWRPEAFNRAVLDFLTKVEAGEPVAGERVL